MRLASLWFFVIALCTLLNSLILQSGRFIELYAGLYITQVIDAIGQGLSSVEPEGIPEPSFFPVLALLIDAVLIGILVVLGVLASKRRKWVFVVGIVWYGLDAIAFLLARQWISGATHGLGLYIIFRGMAALKHAEMAGPAQSGG